MSGAFFRELDIPAPQIHLGLSGGSHGAMTGAMLAAIEAALEKVKPRYERFEGWKQSTANARSLAELPKAARAYLDRIEALCEAPITYVSVGTRRDQIIGL